MADITTIKSVKELQELLEVLLPGDSPLRAADSWPGDYISLRPVLPGQNIAVVVPGEEGQSKNYTLWLEKGQNGFDRFVLASPEILEAVRRHEVIDGVIVPVNSGYNPITRAHVPDGAYEEKDTLWTPDEKPAGFEGKKVWVALNADKPPAWQVITPDDLWTAKRPQEWIVDAKTDTTVGKILPEEASLRGYQLRPAYYTHVSKEPGVAALVGKAREFDDAALSHEPARVINIPPEILGQAAGQQLFIKTQVAPRAPVIPAPQAAAISVPPSPSVIEPGLPVPPEEPVISVSLPPPPEEEARPALPEQKVPPLDEKQMAMLMPPGEIETRQQFINAYDAASRAMQQIKMAYWADVSPPSKLSAEQLETVIAAHEKAYPEFGKALREAGEKMKALEDFSEGPIRVYNEGIEKMHRHFEEKIPSLPDQAANVDSGRAARMYAAAQVPGGPLGEPLPEPFGRAVRNQPAAEPALEVAVAAGPAAGPQRAVPSV